MEGSPCFEKQWPPTDCNLQSVLCIYLMTKGIEGTLAEFLDSEATEEKIFLLLVLSRARLLKLVWVTLAFNFYKQKSLLIYDDTPTYWSVALGLERVVL